VESKSLSTRIPELSAWGNFWDYLLKNALAVKSENNVEPLVNFALEYQRLGWFVLPVHPSEKKPLVKWAYRKDQRPTPEEITGWFEEWSDARIGVATGKFSGFDVVDLDGPRARERFEALYGMPETIKQSTGRVEGGLHLFFKHNGNGLRCHTGKVENQGIDLRTDGGIVVLAPSPHKSGNHYQWSNINPIEDGFDDLLEMPSEIIEHFKGQNGGRRERTPIALDPVERGARNDTLTRLVGKGEGIRNDIARMKKSRLVVAIETSDGNQKKFPAIKLKGSKRCYHTPSVKKWLLEHQVNQVRENGV
jgi:hypothetical protein